MTGRRSVPERRKNERIPLAVPIFVRGRDSEGKEFLEFATALNISAGGALLASRRYVPKLSPVTLEIPSAPLPAISSLPKIVRRLRARVLRVTANNEYHFWALKFSPQLNTAGPATRKVPS